MQHKDGIFEIPAQTLPNVYLWLSHLPSCVFPSVKCAKDKTASRGGREAELKEGPRSTQYRAGHVARAPWTFDFTNISKWEINSLTKGQAQKE